MDVGAQSPKGVPGDVVEVVLPIAVNREYLPSENYTLRNITIKPNISGSRRILQFQLRNRHRKRHQPEHGNHFLAL